MPLPIFLPIPAERDYPVAAWQSSANAICSPSSGNLRLGLYLDGGELGRNFAARPLSSANRAQKDKIDVFVYRDSEDRLVATTETPNAMVGEFAYMKVINVHPQVGAFLDWGLQKDLLVPFREQGITPAGRRLGDCLCRAGCEDGSHPRQHTIEPASEPRACCLS